MQGIPTETYHKLYETLLQCGPFGSVDALRAVFVEHRIAPWRATVPQQAKDQATLVQATIAALCDQYTPEGDNVLVLFLRALSRRKDAGDVCKQALATLADTLEQCPPSPPLPIPPSPRPPVPLQRPPQVPHFTDRERALEALLRDLQPGRRTPMTCARCWRCATAAGCWSPAAAGATLWPTAATSRRWTPMTPWPCCAAGAATMCATTRLRRGSVN
mgnify:CR=1 FL=1